MFFSKQEFVELPSLDICKRAFSSTFWYSLSGLIWNFEHIFQGLFLDIFKTTYEFFPGFFTIAKHEMALKAPSNTVSGQNNGGILSGGFCPGGFCPGDFVQGDFVPGILSGGFVRGDFVLERYQDKIPPDKNPQTKSPQDKVLLDKIPPVYFIFIDSIIF